MFPLAFSMTHRTRIFQSFPFEINYPEKKLNPYLSLHSVALSPKISQIYKGFSYRSVSLLPGFLGRFLMGLVRVTLTLLLLFA